MYGSPTSSHCARAFQLLPNPTSSTNAEIQFVSDPVDAPVDSPIFQLPTFYAFGDCRIGIMNYDTGTSETIEEFATWASIRAAIGRVMTECVVEPQMEGGTERTGRDNEIAVYVYEVRSLFYWRINDLTFANAISDSNLEDIEPENINPVVPMGQAGVQQACVQKAWTSVIDLVMFGASAIFSGGGSICSFSGA
ncbi:MAG: hypothetical protein M1836_006128 [Candelina mexicana]|nr:MAG: hypothetical protein M1836_006128 [Candelina mexicana]